MKPINQLRKIIEWSGLSISAFEKRVGASNNSIQIALKRNANLKDVSINNILNSFPEISPVWFLTGEGSMFVDNKKEGFPSIVNNEPDEILNYLRENLETLKKLNAFLEGDNKRLFNELEKLEKTNEGLNKEIDILKIRLND